MESRQDETENEHADSHPTIVQDSRHRSPDRAENLADTHKEFLKPAKEPQTARVCMVNWIVGAVSVQVQSLWALKIGRLHTDRIDLHKPSLIPVVMTIYGVVELGCVAALVGCEPASSGAG